jgi:hypothetical protein
MSTVIETYTDIKRVKNDKLDWNNWVVGSFKWFSAVLNGCRLISAVVDLTKRSHDFKMSDPDAVDSCVLNFSDLGLNKWLVDQLKAVGLEKPTPIQQHCVPQILKGRMSLYFNVNLDS